MHSSGDEIIEDTSDSSGLEIDLDSDASSMEENDQDIVFRRHRFHHADTDEEDSVSKQMTRHAPDDSCIQLDRSLAQIAVALIQSLKAIPTAFRRMNTIHPTNL